MGLTLPTDPHDFHNCLPGSTIYVLGSGATVDHIPVKFFHDKLVVAVNNVGWRLNLPAYFTVTHYHRDAVNNANARPDLPVIAPVADLGAGGPEAYSGPMPQPNIYYFPTNPQRFGAFDAATDWPTEPHHLVAGPTSLHMAMHFAQYLGAAHIVLVGADCGVIDGAQNFTGYLRGDNPMEVWQRTLGGVAAQLRERGTSVHSLNPWTGLWLEGHTYRSALADIN